MKFKEVRLPGVYLIEPEPIADERGFFSRTWCRREFASHGLNSALMQCNLSFNKKAGTLRGMHYQCAPFCEAKLVRCSMGAVYDVALDLRPESPTCWQWFATELNSQSRHMLYIPEGVAHGFQTLVDDSEVFYQMSASYHPECSRGVRWDDPLFNILWPIAQPVLSAKDRAYPNYSPALYPDPAQTRPGAE